MNTTTEKTQSAEPNGTASTEKNDSRRKWARIMDETRHTIAARNGWIPGLAFETQIAREIASDPVKAKAFLRSAKGQTGRDPQALRHRLLAEVRRSLPERTVHLTRWKRFQKKLTEFLRCVEFLRR